MYRIIQGDKYDCVSSLVRQYCRRLILCDLCNHHLQSNRGLHLSFSQQNYYASALKYLLRKNKKQKKNKHFVDVIQRKGDNLETIPALVEIMRGKQLAALTNHLSVVKMPSCSVPNKLPDAFLSDCQTIRNYEPLLVVPQEDFHEVIPSNLPEISKVKPVKKLKKPKLIPVDVKIKKLEEIKPIPTISLDKDRVNEIRQRLKIPPEVTDEVQESLNQVSVKKKKGPSFKTSLKKKIQEQTALKKVTELERKRLQESLDKNFLSYVDVCVYTGLIRDAFIAVKLHRRKYADKARHITEKISNIQVYNSLITGYAKKGTWLKIKELLTFAEEDGLTFNPQTYAGVLECLGIRSNKSHLVEPYLQQLEKQGYTVDDLLTKTKLSPESKRNVLRAIRSVRPDFTPTPPPLDLNYDCELLKDVHEEASTLVSPAPSTISCDDIKNWYQDQIKAETDNYIQIRTVEKRPENNEETLVYRAKLAETENFWRKTVEEAFDRDLALLRGQSKQKAYFKLTILPYLLTISKEDHVEIIMREIRRLAEGSETYSPSTRQLYGSLGLQVFLRYQVKKKEDQGVLKELEKIYAKFAEWYISPDSTAKNWRQKWQQLLHENDCSSFLFESEPVWKSHIVGGIGCFLYNIIIRDVKFNAHIMRAKEAEPHFLPAFYNLVRCKGHSSREEVKPHPVLYRLYRAAAPDYLVFEASKIPMICPPIPWTSIYSGGYALTKTELIRLPSQAVAQWKILESTPTKQLYPAFDSLNQLGSVPWIVNEEVLDVILEVFTSGGSEELDVPEPPSACASAPSITPETTQQERSQIFKKRVSVRRRRAEMYSLWCDALYKLSLANHFRKKVFWLPHNMDFRGRVYPVAPHLNHLGSDLSRSLLVFAKGQPLGSGGFDWLKIHTINLTGTHKKKSIKERLEHANAIIDDIIDSADRPLTGRMWWKQSEEPWQTLAACIEVRNAIASGDPASYVSRFPVHQDGSCNGLQHYAALGRDQAGGESVNLTPAPVPQDVYSCVSAIVERERAKDAARGVKIAQQLEGHISRKVIKQTVMTTVYGVTRFGARLQIARQLKDLDNFPNQYVWQASMYLVNKTFGSLQEMFTSTKEIQDWFTECSRLIAQICGENVQWVTPLGLPIVQPYSRQAALPDDANKFIGVQAPSIGDAFDRPNVMKQKNAFAPNFIHSLDSSHMMLTSIACEQLGVTFVSVHDCYWTHASTVPIMNRVCRSQFVALHSHPILENLSKYFKETFSYPEGSFRNDGSTGDLAKRNLNRALSDLPNTGSLDLEAVLKSVYFFS